MVDKQLINYIHDRLRAKETKDVIVQSLREVGWEEGEITKSFAVIERSSRKWIRYIKIGFSSIFATALLLYILPIILGLFVKDNPPSLYSDLALKTVSVTASENMYYDLTHLGLTTPAMTAQHAVNIVPVRATSEQTAQVISILSGKTAWNDNLANTLIAENTAVFSIIDQAAQKQKFQIPQFSTPATITINTPSYFMQGVSDAFRMNDLRILYFAHHHDAVDAMRIAQEQIAIGHAIQTSQSDAISILDGIMIEREGLQMFQQSASLLPISSSQSQQITQQLEQYAGNTAKSVGEAEKIEFQIWSSALTSVSTRKEVSTTISNGWYFPLRSIDMNYYFQPNKTIKMLAAYYRQAIHYAQQSCATDYASNAAHPTYRIPLADLITRDNIVGDTLYKEVRLTLSRGMSEKICEENLVMQEGEATAGIAAYKNMVGSYPKTLAQLVPTYLPSIPQDSFTGKALQYNAKNGQVYSPMDSTIKQIGF